MRYCYSCQLPNCLNQQHMNSFLFSRKKDSFHFIHSSIHSFIHLFTLSFVRSFLALYSHNNNPNIMTIKQEGLYIWLFIHRMICQNSETKRKSNSHIHVRGLFLSLFLAFSFNREAIDLIKIEIYVIEYQMWTGRSSKNQLARSTRSTRQMKRTRGERENHGFFLVFTSTMQEIFPW